jgi:hypothetical protein
VVTGASVAGSKNAVFTVSLITQRNIGLPALVFDQPSRTCTTSPASAVAGLKVLVTAGAGFTRVHDLDAVTGAASEASVAAAVLVPLA